MQIDKALITMRNIETYIQREIDRLETKIKEANSFIEKYGYCYAFEWAAPEQLYRGEWLKNKLIDLKKAIVVNPDKVELILQQEIVVSLKFLKNGAFIGTSTSHMSNYATTIKAELQAEYLQICEMWLKWLLDDKK